MSDKIQLQHPLGKKAVRIDTDKYTVMHEAILTALNKPLTHTELTNAVNDLLKKKKISFDGSVEWYLESVKLDMEAKKELERCKENGKLKFQLV